MRRAGLLLVVLALAALAGRLLGYDPVADVHVERMNAGPSPALWLGADALGRDLGRRMLLGVEAFLVPAGIAAGLALAMGLPLGLLLGLGGALSAALATQASNAIAAVPRLVLVLLAAMIHGDGPLVLGLACGVAAVPSMAQAVGDRCRHLARREYILATRAHGVGALRTVLVHLLWLGCRMAILRELLGLLAFVVVVETSLSYLGGFGVAEPRPSWGNILALAERRGAQNPLALLAPALAVSGLLFALGAVARHRGPDERERPPEEAE